MVIIKTEIVSLEINNYMISHASVTYLMILENIFKYKEINKLKE